MMTLSSKWYAVCCCLLVMASLLLGLGLLTSGHDWGGDFAQYIMQAQAMVEGTIPRFLESNRWTMEHSYRPVGPVAYPWGFPLLLTPLYAGWGVNILLFKMVGVAAWLGILIVIGFYGKNRHGPAGLLLVAAFAFNPALLSTLNHIISDIPFMLLSTAAIMAMPGWGGEKMSWWRGFGLGTLVAGAMLVRTNGVLLVFPLAAAQFVQWLLYDRSRLGIRGLLSRENAAPWLVLLMEFGFVTTWLPEGGISHVGQLADVTRQSIQNNLAYYAKLPLAFFEGVPGRHALCVTTNILAGVGLLVRVKRDFPTLLYIGATLIIYVIWPDSMQGLRFLYPVLPFYFSYVGSGFEWVIERIPIAARPRLRMIGCVLAAYMVVMMACTVIGRVAENQRKGRPAPEGPYTEIAQKLFVDVERLASPGDQVVFFEPRVMRLMTGRPAILQCELGQVPMGALVVLYRDAYGGVWPIEEQIVRRAEEEGWLEARSEAERYMIFERVQ